MSPNHVCMNIKILAFLLLEIQNIVHDIPYVHASLARIENVGLGTVYMEEQTFY